AESVLPDSGAAIVERFATVASIINTFYERLHGDDRNTPYPAARSECSGTTVSRPPLSGHYANNDVLDNVSTGLGSNPDQF
ncbi:MAG: hypothetical protein ABIP17_15345, partial [Ilumatobacteraceae bacterium]